MTKSWVVKEIRTDNTIAYYKSAGLYQEGFRVGLFNATKFDTLQEAEAIISNQEVNDAKFYQIEVVYTIQEHYLKSASTQY